VLKRNMKRHLKICNASKTLRHLEKQEYYCKDYNSGSSSGSGGDSDGAKGVVRVDADALLAKITAINADIVVRPAPDTTMTAYESLIVDHIAGGKTATKRVKHPRQDASIVRVLVEGDILAIPPAFDKTTITRNAKGTFVELGAGKGLLGLAVYLVNPRTDVVLVERGGGYQQSAEKFSRNIQATILRDGDAAEREAMGVFQRVQLDLRDCVSANLPHVAAAADPVGHSTGTKLTALGAKHLCGVASDLALHSLTSFGGPMKMKARVSGLGIATCCHHCCNWKDYVGRSFLEEKGVCGDEFDVLCGWTSWATSLRMHRDDDAMGAGKEGGDEEEGEGEGEEHGSAAPGLLTSNRENRPTDARLSQLRRAGWLAKRAMDEGRAVFLRGLGMDAYQRYYCDYEMTPECVMLCATPK